MNTIPWPSWRSLFRGCVREALAAVHSVAKIGTQETHAWERSLRYVADDNQGNVGVIEFSADGAVAAMKARAPERLFDFARAVERAPSRWRDSITQVCRLPLLQEGPGVSTIFWTVEESIRGPVGWSEACALGADVFEHELLDDETWASEPAIEYWNLDSGVAHLVITIASRATVGVPIVELSRDELRQLVPKGSKHESDALGLLTSDGMFEIPSRER